MEEEGAVEEVGEEEEVEEEEVGEAPHQEERPQEEEAMRSSSEQNHPPSVGTVKTLTASFRIFRDTCP